MIPNYLRISIWAQFNLLRFVGPLHKREPNPTNLPLPDYVEGFAIPAIILQASSFSLGNTFVNISDPLWSVWTLSSSSNLSFNTFLIQWYLTSICFDLAWKVEFFPRWIALWLSHNNTYLCCLKPSSTTNVFIHNNSLQASVAAMNSVSVVESVTQFYNLDCQATAPLAKIIK